MLFLADRPMHKIHSQWQAFCFPWLLVSSYVNFLHANSVWIQLLRNVIMFSIRYLWKHSKSVVFHIQFCMCLYFIYTSSLDIYVWCPHRIKLHDMEKSSESFWHQSYLLEIASDKHPRLFLSPCVHHCVDEIFFKLYFTAPLLFF